MPRKKDSEKKVEPALVAMIERKGGLCIKLVTLHFTGLPDRLSLLPGGRIVFCETKTKGDWLSNRQRFVHRQLRGLGFDVRVIDSLEIIKNLENDI